MTRHKIKCCKCKKKAMYIYKGDSLCYDCFAKETAVVFWNKRER